MLLFYSQHTAVLLATLFLWLYWMSTCDLSVVITQPSSISSFSKSISPNTTTSYHAEAIMHVIKDDCTQELGIQISSDKTHNINNKLILNSHHPFVCYCFIKQHAVLHQCLYIKLSMIRNLLRKIDFVCLVMNIAKGVISSMTLLLIYLAAFLSSLLLVRLSICQKNEKHCSKDDIATETKYHGGAYRIPKFTYSMLEPFVVF
jgi:hypothetical protein